MSLLPEPELASMIAEAIDAGLLKTGTREHAVARLVAMKGQATLSSADRLVWETSVLEILSKPLETQIVIQSLARRAHRLARSAGP